jgi:hypothetical protein
MANTLRFKRGLASGIPTALAGEPLFTTDTFDLYIGNGTTNTRFQKYIASGTTSQLLRGDGSLLTMPIVLTSPANGEVLKYNGTTWVNSSDAGITGSGTTNYLSKFTGASTLGNSGVFETSAGNVGIGTTSPLSATGYTTLAVNNTTGGNIDLMTGGVRVASWNNTSSETYFGTRTNTPLIFTTNATERARIFANGNFGINTGATDSGDKLQVIGSAYISDGLKIGPNALTIQSIRASRSMTGSTLVTSALFDAAIQSDVTGGATYIQANTRTAAATFTVPAITLFSAGQTSIGAGSTVTNQFGFIAESSLTGATNNFGFYGNIAAATGRWNLYMNGTANNYMAGRLAIGTTLTTANLTLASSIVDAPSGTNKGSFQIAFSTTNGLSFGTYSTSPFANYIQSISATQGNAGVYPLSLNPNGGAILIGATTSSGEALQVTGTMKVTGASSFGGNMTFSLNQNANTEFRIINTTSGTSSQTSIQFTCSTGNASIGKYSPTTTAYKSVAASDLYFYSTTGDISLLNDNASGNIKFAAGGSSTAQILLNSSGNLGLGTSSVLSKFHVSNGHIFAHNGTGAGSGSQIYLGNNDFNNASYWNSAPGIGAVYSATSSVASDLGFFTYAGNPNSRTERMRIFYTGNLLIQAGGTYTDSGERLQVTGTAKISGEFRVAATINSTQATFANTTGRGLAISTAVVGGTNEAAVVLNARSSVTSGTFIFQTDGTQRMQLDSAGLEFPNNKGLLFENASASPVGSIKMGTGVTNPLEITNGTHTVTLATLGTFISSNLLVGASTIGTSATNTIAVVNGTAPSSSATDIFHLYSADVTAGNAAPHFRTENGAVIKLYQETTAVGNSIISLGGGSAVLDDTTFDGYTLRQIVKALRNQGILA